MKIGVIGVICGSFIFVLLSVFAPLRDANSSPICIVEDGVAKSVIEIDPGASQQIEDAEAELRDFIEQATGAVLPIIDPQITQISAD
jgi:hypothetical protein